MTPSNPRRLAFDAASLVRSADLRRVYPNNVKLSTTRLPTDAASFL
ncbi:MAG: hypothetical protein IJO06_13985 [Thermoguttaceae bacterium]|nr:hypothetical protein [Thermoguttaceae bacterium]